MRFYLWKIASIFIAEYAYKVMLGQEQLKRGSLYAVQGAKLILTNST
jgi:hypothetical protein